MPSEGTASTRATRAVILAGGRGTRLEPFTVTFPKALMPVGDRAILEILLNRLTCAGVTHVTLALGHLSELVRAYVDARLSQDEALHIDYSVEQSPLGTAGALGMIDGLTEAFFVMNGDLLTDIDFTRLYDFHLSSQATMTIATHHRSVQADYGILEIAPDHRLVDYLEKPEQRYSVSMGIYVFEPSVLGLICPGEHLDFPDLVLRLLERDEPIMCWPWEGTWLDIGRASDYARAQELVEGDPELLR